MVKYREILRLHAMGVSIRNIAFSCRCSTATVRAVTGRAKAAGIEWPLPEEMGDRAIREVIYPPKSKADPDKAPIDHDHVDAEMSRPGVTMMLLWSEYCESAVSQGRSPYMYSAFCERHRKWAMSRKTAMRIAHKPAEQMQVDYVGDTMEVVDMDTGEVLKVYVVRGMPALLGQALREGLLRHEGGVLGGRPCVGVLLLRRHHADPRPGQPQAGSGEAHRRRARDQRAVQAHGRVLRMRRRARAVRGAPGTRQPWRWGSGS